MTRTHRNSCRVLTWMLRASLWFASGGGAACPCSMMSTLSSSRLILSLIVLLSCCISSAFSRSSAVTFSSCPSLSSSPWARTFSASPSARSLWLSRPISVTVRLKTFSLEEMSLIWTLVLSTCSLSPWPSCSRPWAMTFTSSHAAYCTRFSLEAPPEGELPFLSKGKPVAESTTRQSVRVASVVFMSPVDLNTLGYGVEVGVCVAACSPLFWIQVWWLRLMLLQTQRQFYIVSQPSTLSCKLRAIGQPRRGGGDALTLRFLSLLHPSVNYSCQRRRRRMI